MNYKYLTKIKISSLRSPNSELRLIPKQLQGAKRPVCTSNFKLLGYTLIEVMVAVSIFSILIAGPAGSFISALRTQSRSLGLRENIDNASYFMDYISRSLRSVRKDDIGGKNCLSAPDRKNYEITHSGEGIKFRNYRDECQEFYLDGGRLKEVKDGQELFLTSDDLEVTSANFQVSGEEQGDDVQPRVTISFEIGRKISPDFSKIQIQTTVSQRNLDITY
jgi:prepilin-type N-terminal cleavage/methylation domain-containing protein